MNRSCPLWSRSWGLWLLFYRSFWGFWSIGWSIGRGQDWTGRIAPKVLPIDDFVGSSLRRFEFSPHNLFPSFAEEASCSSLSLLWPVQGLKYRQSRIQYAGVPIYQWAGICGWLEVWHSHRNLAAGLCELWQLWYSNLHSLFTVFLRAARSGGAEQPLSHASSEGPRIPILGSLVSAPCKFDPNQQILSQTAYVRREFACWIRWQNVKTTVLRLIFLVVFNLLRQVVIIIHQ